MIKFNNIQVEVSTHFVERYRERMLDMAPAMWKNYSTDYKYKLRTDMRNVIQKCEKILFRDLDKPIQDRIHQRYRTNNMVFFKRNNVYYVGAYIKHRFTNQETVLLVTVFRNK